MIKFTQTKCIIFFNFCFKNYNKINSKLFSIIDVNSQIINNNLNNRSNY